MCRHDAFSKRQCLLSWQYLIISKSDKFNTENLTFAQAFDLGVKLKKTAVELSPFPAKYMYIKGMSTSVTKRGHYSHRFLYKDRAEINDIKQTKKVKICCCII